MMGAIDNALSGITAGFERLDKAATRIATEGADGDLAADVVDLSQAKLEVAVNVTALRTASDTVGTLLDVLA